MPVMIGLKRAADVARCRKRGERISVAEPSMITDANQREYVIERPQATEPNLRYRAADRFLQGIGHSRNGGPAR